MILTDRLSLSLFPPFFVCYWTVSSVRRGPRLTRLPAPDPTRGHQRGFSVGLQLPHVVTSLRLAHLASVAVLVEVPSHTLDSEGILPVSGDDGILTDAAHGGKFPGGKGSHTWQAFAVTRA
jgi:hypothetical protein